MKKFLIFILCIASASQLHAALEAFPVAGVEKRKAKKHAAERTHKSAQPATHSDDEKYAPFDFRAHAFSPANVLAACQEFGVPYFEGVEKKLEQDGEICVVERWSKHPRKSIIQMNRVVVPLMAALVRVSDMGLRGLEPAVVQFLENRIRAATADEMAELPAIKERLDALRVERVLTFAMLAPLKAHPATVHYALQQDYAFHDAFFGPTPPGFYGARQVLDDRLRELVNICEYYPVLKQFEEVKALPAYGHH